MQMQHDLFNANAVTRSPIEANKAVRKLSTVSDHIVREKNIYIHNTQATPGIGIKT